MSAGRTHTVTLRLEPAYEVVVGPGLVPRLGELLGASGVDLDRPVALISDETVAQLHAGAVLEALTAAGAAVSPVTVAPGEGSKSLGTVAGVCSALSRAGIDRSGLVVALGGGVVGDLAGFVAAVYLRGLPFVQLPTSLLAMVDASVGGKTGVNLPEGKNLVGAFHQPLAVLADTSLLATLPQRAFREGAVELVKAGLIGDSLLLETFMGDEGAPPGEALRVDAPGLPELVARAVQVKADVVAADPREAGVRAHLNLGHTLAHALETASQHRLPHGEAVAYGLAFVAELGAARGWADWRREARALLEWVRPAPMPAVPFSELLTLMARDKKRLGARRRLVLLHEIGEPRVVDDVSDESMRRAWDALLEVTRDLGAQRP